MRTQVRRACGHCSTGPSGVADQSSSRMRVAISPLPANNDSTSCLSLGAIQKLSTRQHRGQGLRANGRRIPRSRPAVRTGQALDALDERTRVERIRRMALSGIQGKPTGPVALNVLLESDAKLYRAPMLEGRRQDLEAIVSFRFSESRNIWPNS